MKCHPSPILSQMWPHQLIFRIGMKLMSCISPSPWISISFVVVYGVACGRCNGIFGDFGSMQGHLVSKQHYTLGAGIFIPARPRARLREKKGCTGRPWKRRGPTNEIDNRNEAAASCHLRFPRSSTLFPSYLRIITLRIGKNNAIFFFFIQASPLFFFYYFFLI